MKTFLTLLVILMMCSCMPTLQTRAPDKIVINKHWNIFEGYAFMFDDSTILYVSRKEYKLHKIGDTLK